MRLRFLADSVVLEVEDRGVGFGNRDRQGMGLVSMRERAEMVNGRVEALPPEIPNEPKFGGAGLLAHRR